jgi:hypothetical protein
VQDARRSSGDTVARDRGGAVAATQRRLPARDRLIALIAPLLCLGIALSQVTLSQTRDLTPWRGGGFGMFATADHPEFRVVHTAFQTADGPVPVDPFSIEGSHAAVARRAFVNVRALPDDRRADAWAQILMAARWDVQGGVAVFDGWHDPDAHPPLAAATDLGADELVTSVWRLAYDRSRLEARPVLVNQYSTAVPGGLAP